MNIQKMMQQAQAMQKKMQEAQEKLGAIEITGASGGGMVSITVTGKGETKKVKIDPKLIDPADPEMLEDLIVAACNDARRKMEEATSSEMAKVTGGMQLPPGMKMPF